MHLQAGALLKNGEYKIEKVLGQGGFGITYLAEQTSLGRKVALKEFFMEGLCNRDADTSNVSVGSVGSKKLVERFKQKFIKEARMIASFDNNHIISIHDVFEENGTAYYVMEYLGGKSLSAIVNEQGIMSETLALKYIRQVADALAEVHANNLLHLDVKPANIMLNKKGEAVLIDFGISKHYDEAGNQTSSALIGTSEGYAPLEQYEAGALDSFTPATDIYALGATLFFLLTGTRPPKASEVMNYGLPELPEGVSASVRSTIETAMQPAIAKRPQSIAEFLCLVESGKMQDESDGETVLNGNVKGASKREGENLFTHTASESSFDEVKGENGKLVADEFHSIDVVEVPDSEDGNVILSVSEESQSADAVISNEGEKSHSADAVIFRGKPSTARLSESEKSHSANNEILPPFSRQNDKDGNEEVERRNEKERSAGVVISNESEKSQSDGIEILPPFSRQNDKDGNEEVERRNEKEHSAGVVISNEGEKSQKNKPGKSLWLILLLLLLVAVAGAWFLFGGTGNGDAPERSTGSGIDKEENVNGTAVASNNNEEVKNFKENGICYNVIDNVNKRVEVAEGKYTGSIVIPETVVHNDVYYSVTSIGYCAFFFCSGLTSITIPNSVTSIGGSAFNGCSGLTSITIPNSVTSIGDYAFHKCSGLTSITIPNSVTSIEDYAFYGCKGLTSIKIPNSVTSIGSYAFCSCNGLTSITIPNSVKSIGDYAFEDCDGLTSITIGNSVTSIGDYAFRDCSGLTSITIPNSVTSIGYAAFSFCSGLTGITIPNSVTSIGEWAFSGCSGLTSITIPNGVTSIGESAFYECSGLTSITIPNSVTSIGGYAFSFCSGLTSITIPNSVKSIGEGAFSYCTGLENVIKPNGVSIGKDAFEGTPWLKKQK